MCFRCDAEPCDGPSSGEHSKAQLVLAQPLDPPKLAPCSSPSHASEAATASCTLAAAASAPVVPAASDRDGTAVKGLELELAALPTDANTTPPPAHTPRLAGPGAPAPAQAQESPVAVCQCHPPRPRGAMLTPSRHVLYRPALHPPPIPRPIPRRDLAHPGASRAGRDEHTRGRCACRVPAACGGGGPTWRWARKLDAEAQARVTCASSARWRTSSSTSAGRSIGSSIP